MFARRFRLDLLEAGETRPVPRLWLDQFFMRNFTGYSAFDETLPAAEGELEASYAVDDSEIRTQFEKWLRGRKMIPPEAELRVTLLTRDS